jgi:hypothetical protein
MNGQMESIIHEVMKQAKDPIVAKVQGTFFYYLLFWQVSNLISFQNLFYKFSLFYFIFHSYFLLYYSSTKFWMLLGSNIFNTRIKKRWRIILHITCKS